MAAKRITKESFINWLDQYDDDDYIGIPSVHSRCPVATFYKEVHGVESVSVVDDTIEYHFNGKWWWPDSTRVIPPKWAGRLINLVDDRGTTRVGDIKQILEEVS